MTESDARTHWAVPGLAQLFESVLDAASEHRSLTLDEQDRFFSVGETAAEAGIALSALIEGYLAGAGQLWEQAFAGSPGAVAAADPDDIVEVGRSLRKLSERALAGLASGHESAHRRSIRAQEAIRREFLDDLVSGTDPGVLEHRGETIEFPMTTAYVVAVVHTAAMMSESGPIHRRVRAELGSRAPHRELQTFTRQGRIVVIVPDADPGDLGMLEPALEAAGVGVWRVGIGSRTTTGLNGIAESYREAIDALRLSEMFDLDRHAVHDHLTVYRLIASDPALAASLAAEVIGPIVHVRGGTLLDTLRVFIDSTGNMAATARQLAIGTRTVAYRLDRIGELTGHSPRDSMERFTLELALRALPLLGREPPTRVVNPGAR